MFAASHATNRTSSSPTPAIALTLAASLVFSLIVAALCPLPASAMAVAPTLEAPDAGAVECPFHPGQAATLSTAMQYSLDARQAVPESRATPLDVATLGPGVATSAHSPPLRRAEDVSAAASPPAVPLYLLHVSLIR